MLLRLGRQRQQRGAGELISTASSPPSFSHGLDELVREQVLNILGKDDPD